MLYRASVGKGQMGIPSTHPKLGSIPSEQRRAAAEPSQAGSLPSQAAKVLSQRDEWGQHSWGRCKFHVFDRGTFGLLPFTYLLSAQVPGHTFFPNLSKSMTSAASPLVLTRIVSTNHVPASRLSFVCI